MMKIEEVVGDLILLILDNHEPLKKIGIDPVSYTHLTLPTSDLV